MPENASPGKIERSLTAGLPRFAFSGRSFVEANSRLARAGRRFNAQNSPLPDIRLKNLTTFFRGSNVRASHIPTGGRRGRTRLGSLMRPTEHRQPLGAPWKAAGCHLPLPQCAKVYQTHPEAARASRASEAHP